MSIKKTSFSVAAAVALSLSGVAIADASVWGLGGFNQSAVAPKSNHSILSIDNSISVAAAGTLMNYQEHINPGPSDTESGWMPGFKVTGNYMGQNHVYLHLGYQYNSGGIHYDGANLETHAAVQTTDRATTQQLLGKIGYGFFMDNGKIAVTPYVAAGYQSWHRNLEIPVGQEIEDYSATLAGTGALFQYQITPRLVFSADSEFLAVTGGGMTPHITGLDLGSAHFGVSGEEKVAVSANYRISGPWSVFGGLNFTHFNYTGGAITSYTQDVTDASEPPSSTNLFGMDAGIRYSF
ncbi:outer membrane beta-barrel protein [Acidithiobacillus thiooxidans]|uniref:outer membrane beta-barrel protein n=1 Tax=Acidithiobacillus thiooxidans TaxID=930 RepID=UPI0006894CC4|nr:outer membrane beta-barrel protein [Acidithiobacillus thiooxidans]